MKARYAVFLNKDRKAYRYIRNLYVFAVIVIIALVIMHREGMIVGEDFLSSIIFTLFMTFMMTPSALILGTLQDDRLSNKRMISVPENKDYIIDDVVENLNNEETKNHARSLLVVPNSEKPDSLQDIYYITNRKF